MGLPWIAAVGSLAASRGCHGPLELVVVLLQIMKLYAISRRSVETAASRTATAGSSGVGATIWKLCVVPVFEHCVWLEADDATIVVATGESPAENHALMIVGNFAFNV